MSIAGGVQHALEEAARLRCDTLQIFVKNQRQWAAPPLDTEELRAWEALRADGVGGPVLAHATYLINLASPDRVLLARSQGALADELRRCQQLGVTGLVVHPGAATDGRVIAGLRRVARSINRVYELNPRLRVRLLLETTAGQGSSLGHTFEQLAEIIAAVGEPARVGVCVDSCHVFAAGHDIRAVAGYRALRSAAERSVGLDRICAWHLNDSQGACGARLDRHAHIGRGQIGLAGFRNVLSDPQFFDVPMILETPKGVDESGREYDRINLRRLRTLSTRARRGAAD